MEESYRSCFPDCIFRLCRFSPKLLSASQLQLHACVPCAFTGKKPYGCCGASNKTELLDTGQVRAREERESEMRVTTEVWISGLVFPES